MNDDDYPPHIAYSVGVLKPNTHYKMVANLRAIAGRAGIPEEAIYTSINETLSPTEKEMMGTQHRLFQDGYKGVVYLGDFKEPVLDKFSAIIGVFIRNFCIAKLRMNSEVMASLKSGDYDYLKGKYLAIPDFFTIGTGSGKKLFDNDIGLLMSFLYRRANSKELTFLHIEDMDLFRVSYGNAFYKFLQTYKVITPEDIQD